MDDVEVWAPIPGHPGYEASTLGRIRSVDRDVRTKTGFRRYKGRILRLSGDPQRRLVVSFGASDGYRPRKVHQLVLETFVSPRPEGMEGCHFDGDPTNNRVTNLSWGTHSQNMHDMVRHGRHHMQNRKAV